MVQEKVEGIDLWHHSFLIVEFIQVQLRHHITGRNQKKKNLSINKSFLAIVKQKLEKVKSSKRNILFLKVPLEHVLGSTDLPSLGTGLFIGRTFISFKFTLLGYLKANQNLF